MKRKNIDPDPSREIKREGEKVGSEIDKRGRVKRESEEGEQREN